MSVTTSNQAPSDPIHLPRDFQDDDLHAAAPAMPLSHSYDTIESAAAPIQVEAPPPAVKKPIGYYVRQFFNRFKSKTQAPVAPENKLVLKTDSRKWLEQEMEELRVLMETSDVNIESFLDKLATLASLSFTLTSQIEADERNELYEQLKLALQEQQDNFHDKKVFCIEAVIATFGILAGSTAFVGSTGMVARMANPFAQFITVQGEKINSASNMITSGMQSGSKLATNFVDAKKAASQALLERIKGQIQASRERSSTHDRQASEVESRLHQARQLLQSVVDKIAG